MGAAKAACKAYCSDSTIQTLVRLRSTDGVSKLAVVQGQAGSSSSIRYPGVFTGELAHSYRSCASGRPIRMLVLLKLTTSVLRIQSCSLARLLKILRMGIQQPLGPRLRKPRGWPIATLFGICQTSLLRKVGAIIDHGVCQLIEPFQSAVIV